MRQDFVEEAAKGWIAYAMEGSGYAPWEIRRIMEIAYRYQHDAGCVPWEDAVKRYRYYRPERETRLLAAQEAAV